MVRKFLDEAANAGSDTQNSEMWYPRFRFAEALLIAAEAAYELGGTNKVKAVEYINRVRARGGIKELTESTITFEHIVNEYRVEFAFEDHRFWDVRRWKILPILYGMGSLTVRLHRCIPFSPIRCMRPVRYMMVSGLLRKADLIWRRMRETSPCGVTTVRLMMAGLIRIRSWLRIHYSNIVTND